MKGEAVALTDEEHLYQEEKRRYEEAGRDLDKARKKLYDWEEEHGDDNDRYRELDQRLQNAKQDVKDAHERLKYARAMVEANRLGIAAPPLLAQVDWTATPFSRLIPDVAPNERKGDADRKRKAADPRSALKKPRRDHDSGSTTAKTLMSAIRGCNMDQIFDIESVLELPFPSLLATPNRFQLNKGAFKYQAWSDLKPLYDKIVRLWMEGRPITVNVAGTIGYGKSHILAVLVLLMLKNAINSEDGSTPFVCYIPDCRELLATEAAVMTILQRNILLNMPEFSGRLGTIEDIRAVMQDQKVILVADQWNSTDDGNADCRTARERLGSCFGTSVCVEIHGMSMNASTWRALLPKQTSQDHNIYCGGFNDDEFGVWLQRHPAIFTEHEDEVALLTGRVPLLLSGFARVYNDGDSWESVVKRVQQDAIVEDWMTLLV